MRSFREFLYRLFRPKNLFHIDNILSMSFAFLMLYALSNLNFEILNPIGEAFSDVDVTDLAYSQLGKNEDKRGVDEHGIPRLDTNVVIVNIGDLSRKEIAEQIFKINQNGAKVIGVDAFFDGDRDPIGDMMLESAIRFGKNVILVSKAVNYSKDDNFCDSIEHSNSKFQELALKTGLANMVTDNEGTDQSKFNICRSFLVKAHVRKSDHIEYSFPIELACHLDSSAVMDLIARENDEEYINFSGNIHRDFMTLPYNRFKVYDVNYRDDNWCAPNAFKNKIVLMGFLGSTLDEVTGEDKFFTPFNHKYVGKSDLDMYGVVVHANSISMILERDFIDEFPKWLSHLIGFLITYLLFAAFRGIFNDYKVWYDGLTKLLSLILIAVVLYFELLLFDAFDYKIAFSGMYFAIIAFSGDFLEIYYGLIKNVVYKVFPKSRKLF